MKIKREIEAQIIEALGRSDLETGGIIGIKDDAICAFCFDKGTASCKKYYEPNVAFLNSVIQNWEDNGITFAGMIHSHPCGNLKLSIEDMEYATRVKNAMPDLKCLLFPIFTVKNNEAIIVYYDVLNNFAEITIFSD